MSLNKEEKTKSTSDNLEKFFFNGLIFTVIIIFPTLLFFLTWRFWS